MKNQENLSEKAWYRFLKVFYVLAYLVCFAVVAFIGYIGWHEYNWNDMSSIKVICDNKKVYKFTPSQDFYSIDKVYFNAKEEVYVKRLCAYGVGQTSNETLPFVLERNYKIDYITHHEGSWKKVIFYTAIGWLVAYLIIEAVKSMLLYVLGVSIWRGGLLYGLLFISEMFKNDKKTKV